MHYSDAFAVRQGCRTGSLAHPTAGLAPGYLQANLVALPQSSAFDFMRFCHRNPKPCPLLDVTDPGSAEPNIIAPGSDLRTDLPKYWIFKNGEKTWEVEDVREYWQEETVGFLTGCSFTFEAAMLSAGLPVRHVEQGVNVPMYKTSIECKPAGRFRGPLVVSMRPLGRSDAIRSVEITSRFPKAHGSPVHIGDPQAIGIEDIQSPDFGNSVDIRDGEIPVFWACGVTNQMALENAKLEMAITHAPGHMFLADVKDVDVLF